MISTTKLSPVANRCPRLLGRIRPALLSLGLVWFLEPLPGQDLPPMTNIAAIKMLSPEMAARELPIRIRGVATTANPIVGDFFLQDEVTGIYVGPSSSGQSTSVGDLLEIEGTTDPGGFAPMVVPRSVRKLGTAPLPPARPVTVTPLKGGQIDSERVVIEGRIRGYRSLNNNVTLGVTLPDGSVIVELQNVPPDRLPPRLRGAHVRVTGVAAPGFNPLRQATHARLITPTTHDVEILRPGPENMATLPTTAIADLLTFRPDVPSDEPVRITGTVTAVISPRAFFLQDESGGVLVRLRNPADIVPASRLELVGVADAESDHAIFWGDDLNEIGFGPLPSPLVVVPAMLGDLSYFRRRISLDAKVVTVSRSLLSKAWEMSLDFGGNSLVSVLAGTNSFREPVPTGSRVRLTGVLDRGASAEQDLQGMRLYLASSEDLAVIGAPPFDVTRFLLLGVAGLSVFGVLVLAWASILRRRVASRTRALMESHARLNEAQRLAQIGSWELDLTRNKLLWSEETYRIFEIDPADFGASNEAFLNLVHPEDRSAVNEAYTESVKKGTAYEITHRLLMSDGRIKYVHERCETFYDHNGVPLRSIGTVQDITDRKRAEEALRIKDDAIASAIAGIAMTDMKGRLTYANPAWLRMHGYESAAEVLGTTPFQHVQEGANAEAIIDAIKQHGYWSSELPCRRRDGSVFPTEMAAALVMNPAGKPVGMMASFQDITKRKRAEEGLLHAKEAAERANRAKSDFLATMSHEIRTPMNGILGMTELLQQSRLDARQRELAESIRTSGKALLNIINDILDLSKIEAGRMALVEQEFELRPVVEGVVELFARSGHGKPVEVRAEWAEAVPGRLRGDSGRLRQVLLNLVGNGLKFTADGSVVVRVRVVDRTEAQVRLRFEVSDTGIGISVDKRPLLFQAFQQLDSSDARRHGGTGLGLAISRRLVEMMGGRMDVESEEGKGSTFWFELPLPAAAGAAPSEGEVSLAGLRVLVFEDHPINQRLTLLSLGKLGCQTEPAPSGEAMLNRLKAEPWDAVIFAYALPDMPTAEFVGKLAPSQPGRPWPAAILCLLPTESSALRESLGSAGVHAFLHRPFTVQQLREALTHARKAAGWGRNMEAGLR